MELPISESAYSEAYLTPPMDKTEDLLMLDDIYSSTPDTQSQSNASYDHVHHHHQNHHQQQQQQQQQQNSRLTLPKHQQHQNLCSYTNQSWNYQNLRNSYSTDYDHSNQKSEIEDSSVNYGTDSLSPFLPALYLSESSSGLEPNSRLSISECGSLTTGTCAFPTNTTTAPAPPPSTTAATPAGTITMALDLITNSTSSSPCWNSDSVALSGPYVTSQYSPLQNWITSHSYALKSGKTCSTQDQSDSKPQPDTTVFSFVNYGNPGPKQDRPKSNAIWTPNNWPMESDPTHQTKKHFTDGFVHYQLVPDHAMMNHYPVGPKPDQLTPIYWDHNCHLMPTSTDCRHLDSRSMMPDMSLHWNNYLCSASIRNRTLDLCSQTCGSNSTRSGMNMKGHLKSNTITSSIIHNSNNNNNDNTHNHTHNHNHNLISNSNNSNTVMYSHICPNQQQPQFVSNMATSSKHYHLDPSLNSPTKHFYFDPMHNTHLTYNISPFQQQQQQQQQHHHLHHQQQHHTSSSTSSSLEQFGRLSKKRHCKRRYSCNRSSDTSSSQHTLNSSHPSMSLVVKQVVHHELDFERIRQLIPAICADAPSKWLQNPGNLFQTLCIHRGLITRTATDFMSRDSIICDQIQFRLKDFEIWAQMCVHDTEMIATNMGRRIFPSLSVDVFGLNPSDEYIFVLDMVLIQPHVFKHQNGKWVVSAQSEEPRPSQAQEGQIYIQEDSPKSGAYWMESGINFIRAKITNSKEVKMQHNMIHVHSMQYYLPRFTVIRLTRSSGSQYNICKPGLNFDSHLNPHLHNQYDLIGCYVIPGTQFYTVTAYQNPDVIRIKINNNPFAKGFRNRQDGSDLEDSVLSAMGMRPSYTDSTGLKFA